MGLYQFFRKRLEEGQGARMPLPEFSSSERVRRRCVFHGTVQGVGFRYESCFLAERLGLVGWIRNCPDGTVEAELEGERDRVDHFIQGMKSIRRIRVTRVECADLPLRGDEDTFHVIY